MVKTNNSNIDNLILYMASAARLVFAQKWKCQDISSIDDWLLKILSMAELAKLSSILKDQNTEAFFANLESFNKLYGINNAWNSPSSF